MVNKTNLLKFRENAIEEKKILDQKILKFKQLQNEQREYGESYKPKVVHKSFLCMFSCGFYFVCPVCGRRLLESPMIRNKYGFKGLLSCDCGYEYAEEVFYYTSE